jgi:hypothetical protein
MNIYQQKKASDGIGFTALAVALFSGISQSGACRLLCRSCFGWLRPSYTRKEEIVSITSAKPVSLACELGG